MVTFPRLTADPTSLCPDRQELRGQLEVTEHLCSAASDELDAALATLSVSDDDLQRSLLGQTRRWLTEQTTRLRAADRSSDLAWLERRAATTLTAADRAEELAPTLAAMETVHAQLGDWERRTAARTEAIVTGSSEEDPAVTEALLESARRVSRAAALRRRLAVRVAALRPVCDQLTAVRRSEMVLYRRLMMLELLRKAGAESREGHVSQLMAEVAALHRLVAALKKKHPHCRAVQVRL